MPASGKVRPPGVIVKNRCPTLSYEPICADQKLPLTSRRAGDRRAPFLVAACGDGGTDRPPDDGPVANCDAPAEVVLTAGQHVVVEPGLKRRVRLDSGPGPRCGGARVPDRARLRIRAGHHVRRVGSLRHPGRRSTVPPPRAPATPPGRRRASSGRNESAPAAFHDMLRDARAGAIRHARGTGSSPRPLRRASCRRSSGPRPRSTSAGRRRAQAFDPGHGGRPVGRRQGGHLPRQRRSRPTIR